MEWTVHNLSVDTRAWLSKHTAKVVNASRKFTPNGATWKTISLQMRPQAKELKRLLSALPKQEKALHAFSSRAANEFLSLGSSLEELTQLSNSLVKESERLLVLATGRLEGAAVLESAVGLLQPALEMLDQSCLQMDELVSRLSTCRGKVRQLLELKAQLRATIQPLAYIQTLFKIESAKLPEATQQLFVAVTTDISRLEKEVAAMFEEKFTLLESMEASVAELATRLETSLPLHKETIRDSRRGIEEKLTELRLQLQENTNRDIVLTRRTQDVADRVNIIVMGLQYQDIIAQKLQHISSEMKEFHAENVHGRSDNLKLDEAAIRRINELARVQHGQLNAVAADLNSAHDQIEKSVQAVLNTSDSIDCGAVTLQDFKSVTVSADGMIQVLLDSGVKTRALVNSAAAEAKAAYEVVHSIGSMTESLTTTMMGLAISMHFIALNAQIQSVQVGAGTGLETLAAKTADLSVQTTDLSEQAVSGLETLATAMKEIVADFSSVKVEAEEHREKLLSDGNRVEAMLHDLRNRSFKALEAVGESSLKIRDVANTMLKTVAAGRNAEPDLGASMTYFQMLMERSDQLLVDSEAPAAEIDRDVLRSKYTMESERQVHLAALASATVQPPSATAVVEDPIFFDEIPLAPPRAPTEATEKKEDSNVELF